MCRLVLLNRQQGTLLYPSTPEENNSSRHEELVHRELCEELALIESKSEHELI